MRAFTWSATPPTIRGLVEFSRAIPPSYGQRRAWSCSVITGRRSLVAQKRCITQLVNECISTPQSGRRVRGMSSGTGR
jgi:hypothetical protein